MKAGEQEYEVQALGDVLLTRYAEEHKGKVPRAVRDFVMWMKRWMGSDSPAATAWLGGTLCIRTAKNYTYALSDKAVAGSTAMPHSYVSITGNTPLPPNVVPGRLTGGPLGPVGGRR